MAADTMELALASFRGPDTTVCFRAAAAALGEDAVVLRTVLHGDAVPSQRAEVVAAPAAAIERFRARLTPVKLDRPDRAARQRPLVIALVGPTGAGKSTTAAKLARHAEAFGQWRAGIITLDSRPGALEQLHAHAQAGEVPLEMVYEPAQAAGALRRLTKARCDVIIVDTPGQGPRTDALAQRWSAALRALSPDEIHLVVPATHRADLAAVVRTQCAALGVTHALVTKLDEVPGGHGLTELAIALGLPVRWVCDGQDASADVRNGAPRLLGTLGVASTVPAGVVATAQRTASAGVAAAGATAATRGAAPHRRGILSFLTGRGAVAVGR
jgi:flagellar biosynthesis protein FlhF